MKKLQSSFYLEVTQMPRMFQRCKFKFQFWNKLIESSLDALKMQIHIPMMKTCVYLLDLMRFSQTPRAATMSFAREYSSRAQYECSLKEWSTKVGKYVDKISTACWSKKKMYILMLEFSLFNFTQNANRMHLHWKFLSKFSDTKVSQLDLHRFVYVSHQLEWGNDQDTKMTKMKN